MSIELTNTTYTPEGADVNNIHNDDASDLTIIIPAYNEESGLGTTLQDVLSETRLRGATILVIDDGSTDNTAEVAEQAGAIVISLGRNRGYGFALPKHP